jgi:hypothetical protein
VPHDHDPLNRLLDPDRRSQVGGFLEGPGIFIQVLDTTTGQGVVMDVMSALEVASDINNEAVRLFELMAGELQHGTTPMWKRLFGGWGPHGEGTAEKN